MQPVKIIYFIEGLDIGGAEIQLYCIITRLDQKRYRPIVVSLIKPGSVGEVLRDAGIPIYFIYLLVIFTILT